MYQLKVTLFGKFCVCRGNQPLVSLEARKVQELFGYLLIHRNRLHPREKLANLLWENSSPSQSKQYFRQTLWQLQSVLDDNAHSRNNILSLESEWIQINPAANLWIDISEFEEAFSSAHGKRGRELNKDGVNTLQNAINLYQGELLENWYQDWCILERERFQNMYLTMLDKLMEHCETHQKFEDGIDYGNLILRHDVAHERTYRRLMRLYYFAGDRCSALRQYERCFVALEHELNIKPANHTVELYNQIKQDQLHTYFDSFDQSETKRKPYVILPGILIRLAHIHTILLNAQEQVEQDIDVVKNILEQ